MKNIFSTMLAKSVLVVLVAGLILAGALSIVEQASAAPGVPPAVGSTRGSVNTVTYINGTQYATTATVYSAAQRPNFWYQADAFVTVDVSGTATAVVTPQFSADATNWTDAYYQTVSGTTVTNQSYALTLSADGTSYTQFPLAGEYVRFKVAVSGFAATTDRITVTVKATSKNTQ